jgi:diadenosine tetraphosphate (Ap4A) HIT family hydrolase
MTRARATPGRYALHAQLADDTHPLATFELSELRLMDDSNYPWLVLVPQLPDAVELIDLDAAQRHLLTDEIDRAGRALRHVFRPDKLNVAALGNQVLQLHVHVIARFRDDPAWPRPVWGMAAAKPYSAEMLIERVRMLQDALAAAT